MDENPVMKMPSAVGMTLVVDDTVLGAATLTNNDWVFTWDTTTVANGSYALTSVAHDAAGNTTTSNPMSVVVQN